MYKIAYLSLTLVLFSFVADAQSDHKDSLEKYLKEYVEKHEVVTGDDKKLMTFFPVNKTYRVSARFEKVKDGAWFNMETSGRTKKVYRVYGTIHFSIHDTALQLNIYQSQQLMAMEEYKEHLFLPFTDLTSGTESYSAGRYIDLSFSDIQGDKITIDFNKAYNPYCAYVSGKYNCPIPPRENSLNVAILAGEKEYKGSH